MDYDKLIEDELNRHQKALENIEIVRALAAVRKKIPGARISRPRNEIVIIEADQDKLPTAATELLKDKGFNFLIIK